MRIQFESADSTNSDIEIVFISIAVLSLVSGWIVQSISSVMPVCQFRKFTGWPCPGCGGTRAAALLSRAKVTDAFLMNPLVTLMALATAAFASYSALALLCRMPRFRIRISNDRERRLLGVLFILAAAADWIYLIAVGR